MPAIRQNDLLLRLLKDVNDIRSALRHSVANLPLFDIDNENTPAALTSDQDDYVPGNYDVLRLSCSGTSYTISGFTGGVKGRHLTIYNVGDYELILAHQDTGSAAANRLITQTGQSIYISTNGHIELYYDETSSRWRCTAVGKGSSGDDISVELRLTVQQSIPNAAYTTISWESVVEDTGDFFQPGSPTLVTIPETGWYYVQAQLAWTSNDNGARHLSLENSLAVPYASMGLDVRSANAGAATGIQLSSVDFLPKGATVSVTVWQNSGGALSVVTAGPRGNYTSLVVKKM